jgi:hypothetical protein
VNTRARACAWVRTHVWGTTWLRLGVGRKGGGTAVAAAQLRPTPWVAAGKATAVGTNACEEAAAGGEACTRRPRGRRSLPCDRVCEAFGNGEAMAARPTGAHPRGPAQEKEPKVQPCLPGWRARVLGCTLARGRRACADARVNANAPTRDRERGQYGVHTTARRARLGKRRARVDEGGGTCKRFNLAWLDNQHHQRWRRGGAVRATRSPSARRPGRPHRAGECSSSPWWPRAVVQALVKRGGAAHRRGGRRRRWRCDGVEVVEAVEAGALDNGGSGSSHGRLRSSRRTALPRAPPIPPSPPFTSPPPASRRADRGVDSPEAARVGRSPGVSVAALIAAGGAGARGRLGCTGGRGARCDGEATAGAPRFSFGCQPKWQRQG